MPKKRKAPVKSKTLLQLFLVALGLSIVLLAILSQTNHQPVSLNQLTTPSVFPDVDPQTQEFYDFWIQNQITTTNIGNTTTLTKFTLGGPRLANITSLYGFKQTSDAPLGPTRIDFTYNPNNRLWDRFTATANLAANNCIDFHSSSQPNRTNYIATACYRNTFVNPNETGKIVYGASGNFFLKLSYRGTKTTSIQFFSTAFDKYVSKPAGYEAGPIMARVNSMVTDYNNSTLTDFYDVTYNLTGLLSGLDANTTRLFCQDPDSPQKYIKFTSSNPKPDGGSNYQVTRKSGYCGFELDSPTLKYSFMSIWMEGGVPLPTVNQPPTIQTGILPAGVANQSYTATISTTDPDATNITAPTSITVSGLPTGLRLGACSFTYKAPVVQTTCGLIGKPVAVGNFKVVINAIDVNGQTATKTLPLTILKTTTITPIDPQPVPLVE